MRYKIKVGDIVWYNHDPYEVYAYQPNHEDPKKRLSLHLKPNHLFSHQYLYIPNIIHEVLETAITPVDKSTPVDLSRDIYCLPFEWDKITLARDFGDRVIRPSLRVNHRVKIKNYKYGRIVNIRAKDDCFEYLVQEDGSAVLDRTYLRT